MKLFSYARVEIGRVFRSPLAWTVMVITMLSPLFGYDLYQPAATDTRAGHFLANPVLAGTLAATVLFALLTIYEMSRVHASHVDVLTNSIASPIVLQVARYVGVLVAATAACLVTAVLYLPYTASSMDNVFYLPDYVGAYLILMMMGAWLGCTLGAALYQITRRVDLSVVLIAGLVTLSLSQYLRDDFILRFINPIIPTLSDDFSNMRPLAMALYNRIFWLLTLGGIWAFSLLCVRRYGKKLFGSIAHNAKRFYVPILAVLLICAGTIAYANQPFVNHAPVDVHMDEMLMHTELPKDVLLHSIEVDAAPNVRLGTHHATATYHMSNTSGEPKEIISSLNSGYQIKSLTINGNPAAFEDLNDDTLYVKHVTFQLPPGDNLEVTMAYGGYPQMWPFQVKNLVGDEVSPQYICLRSQSFAPHLHTDNAQDCTFTTEITIPEHMEFVLVNDATITRIGTSEDGSARWRLEQASDRLFFYAADYMRSDASVEEGSVHLYYSKKHDAIMQAAHANDVVHDVVRYCLDNLGPLSLLRNGQLKIVQQSIFQGAGSAGGDSSHVGESVFAEDNLNDPILGATAQDVLAHEIIHQWWGGEKMFFTYDIPEHNDPEWSSEGFTCYTTYRMMKDKHGAEYAQKHYVDVWQQQADALARDFYQRHPEYLDRLPEHYTGDIARDQQHTLWYCIMPLKILKAEQLIGGEEAMDAVMQTLLTKQDTMIPYNLFYQDFLDACGLTKEDLLL